MANFTNDRRRGAAIMASYLTGPAFKYWETMSPRVKEDYNLIGASLLERFKYKSTLDLELELRQMKYNTDTPLESFVSHYEYIAYELGLPENSMILCFGDCFPDDIRDKLLEAAPKTFDETVTKVRHLLSIKKKQSSNNQVPQQSSQNTDISQTLANIGNEEMAINKLSDSIDTVTNTIATLSDKVSAIDLKSPGRDTSRQRDRRVRFDIDQSRSRDSSRSRSRSPAKYDRDNRYDSDWQRGYDGRFNRYQRPYYNQYRGRGRQSYNRPGNNNNNYQTWNRNFRPKQRPNSNNRQNNRPQNKMKCWFCEKPGHRMADCYKMKEHLNTLSQ